MDLGTLLDDSGKNASKFNLYKCSLIPSNWCMTPNDFENYKVSTTPYTCICITSVPRVAYFYPFRSTGSQSTRQKDFVLSQINISHESLYSMPYFLWYDYFKVCS